MKTNIPTNILVSILATLVIAGGFGFFAGTKYQQSKQQTFFRQFDGSGQGMVGMRNGNFQNQGQRMGGQNGNRMIFRPIAGEIISSDDKSITVKMQDGNSKIVLISDSTSINKAAQASKTDLTTGTTVAVFGQTNSDGSVTVQSIQLNPEFRGREIPPQGVPNQNGQGINSNQTPAQ